ncbi:hypothetical protein AZE99_13300 [Sphingorhabdus sp. M41]|nr:hypothetical protein AZE99_13300 [Sphingorhabdus sp. M41]
MLKAIYSAGPDARDFDITFNSNSGSQQNDCRDLMIAYQQDPKKKNGRAIAQRLQSMTDNRSGIGLLFLISGNYGLNERLVVSRFPTDQAILAEVDSTGLDVEFLDRVFVKRMSSYKALLLDDKNPAANFWNGKVTDRQAGGSAENISDYWIGDFLDADFTETAAAGTKRLVVALKNAIKNNPNLEVKGQIASATTLAPTTFKNKNTSIKEFCDHFGFSHSTQQTIKNFLKKPSLFEKKFKFDHKEFKDKAPYRTVEIDNGAILTAPSEDFEKVFTVRERKGDEVEYATSGRISDQRLTKK